MLSTWPKANREEIDEEVARIFGVLQEMVSGIRNVRNQYNVPPGKPIAARLSINEGDRALKDQLATHPDYFEKLARVEDLLVEVDAARPPAAASVVVGLSQVYIPLADMIDLSIERERLQKEIGQKEQFLGSLRKKLANELFTTRAPKEVVDRERQKAGDVADELEKLRESLAELA
jgi:valyl-tRNA synthetase